eukprot:TRINITY_DN66461_c5_g4_i5.p1 TRINITY_DN66461_c5_g4~~TRINITY_DN66461_c5_g4_i5.p1  ORF type:complete len:791 (+),score=96.51 TRINITY_DN66461_c5_g4_i5:65-2437(+)
MSKIKQLQQKYIEVQEKANSFQSLELSQFLANLESTLQDMTSLINIWTHMWSHDDQQQYNHPEAQQVINAVWQGLSFELPKMTFAAVSEVLVQCANAITTTNKTKLISAIVRSVLQYNNVIGALQREGFLYFPTTSNHKPCEWIYSAEALIKQIATVRIKYKMSTATEHTHAERVRNILSAEEPVSSTLADILADAATQQQQDHQQSEIVDNAAINASSSSSSSGSSSSSSSSSAELVVLPISSSSSNTTKEVSFMSSYLRSLQPVDIQSFYQQYAEELLLSHNPSTLRQSLGAETSGADIQQMLLQAEAGGDATSSAAGQTAAPQQGIPPSSSSLSAIIPTHKQTITNTLCWRREAQYEEGIMQQRWADANQKLIRESYHIPKQLLDSPLNPNTNNTKPGDGGQTETGDGEGFLNVCDRDPPTTTPLIHRPLCSTAYKTLHQFFQLCAAKCSSSSGDDDGNDGGTSSSGGGGAGSNSVVPFMYMMLTQAITAIVNVFHVKIYQFPCDLNDDILGCALFLTDLHRIQQWFGGTITQLLLLQNGQQQQQQQQQRRGGASTQPSTSPSCPLEKPTVIKCAGPSCALFSRVFLPLTPLIAKLSLLFSIALDKLIEETEHIVRSVTTDYSALLDVPSTTTSSNANSQGKKKSKDEKKRAANLRAKHPDGTSDHLRSVLHSVIEPCLKCSSVLTEDEPIVIERVLQHAVRTTLRSFMSQAQSACDLTSPIPDTAPPTSCKSTIARQLQKDTNMLHQFLHGTNGLDCQARKRLLNDTVWDHMHAVIAAFNAQKVHA